MPASNHRTRRVTYAGARTLAVCGGSGRIRIIWRASFLHPATLTLFHAWLTYAIFGRMIL